jgi:hypothetical protein
MFSMTRQGKYLPIWRFLAALGSKLRKDIIADPPDFRAKSAHGRRSRHKRIDPEAS